MTKSPLDGADLDTIAACDAFCANLGPEVEPEVLFAGVDQFIAAFVANGSDEARRRVEELEAWRSRVLGSLG